MDMKFRAHETFFIRKGWLSKGIRAVEENPEVFIMKAPMPMDALGIGANMVKSLRYWMQATDLTKEPKSGKRIQTFTEFGNLVRKYDRYTEEIGTLYLIHYKLISNAEKATSWYYLFNLYQPVELVKDDFISSLNGYVISKNGEGAAMRSYTDDFNCIIGTYVPRYQVEPSKVSPENNIDCPLGELGLITVIDRVKKVYRKTSPSVDTLDPWVVLAVMMDNLYGRKELSFSFNELLTSPCNIGRVFNMDVITMLDVLQRVERTEAIKIIRTAGLDTVRVLKKYTFNECVEKYYKNIEESRG
jgi:hypothetical protein